ncbi:MAG: hypothetical protein DA328_06955 [Nitrososphaeraceae archaeon]|nr:hypothetical protein [Nitrososphaeraceae archaeon]
MIKDMKIENRKLDYLSVLCLSVLTLVGSIVFIIGTNYNLGYSLEKISDLNFMMHMELMKGHNEQAIANKESGNGFLAEKHIEHSLYESFGAIKNQLTNSHPDLDKKFSTEFNYLRSIAQNSTETEFIEAVKNSKLIDEISNTLVPNTNTTFTLLTIGKILDSIIGEYNAAVDGEGNIQAIIEYQDSLGFISRADALINQVVEEDSIFEKNELKKIDNSINIIQDKLEKKIQYDDVVEDLHNTIGMILKITNVNDAVMYS